MMIYKELSFEQESANIKFLKHLPNYSQQVSHVSIKTSYKFLSKCNHFSSSLCRLLDLTAWPADPQYKQGLGTC